MAQQVRVPVSNKVRHCKGACLLTAVEAESDENSGALRIPQTGGEEPLAHGALQGPSLTVVQILPAMCLLSLIVPDNMSKSTSYLSLMIPRTIQADSVTNLPA